MKKEKVCLIGSVGVVIGMMITIFGLVTGLILGLNDSEIINRMSIGLVIFLGGMVLIIYYQTKRSNEFFRTF